ncbi:hypothetical protein RUE5091_00152 [Ruegeria denitrificans]|uniref:Uncharacterized protein n=1 Tax=Ruegeria denitrificans TaxID=1715692 RepID=A0A0P1I0X5_9RHOB|nr:hypothetical protein [Ruegeria denitrificans]CUJ83836.1 hypothetical protein RUE5091_00152 [Ruegeria denitrificans]
MDKLLELTGVQTASIWVKLLILATVMTVGDVHSQMNGKNIFTVNSFEYISNNFFGLCAVFALLSIFVISLSLLSTMLLLALSNVAVRAAILLLSELGNKNIHRCKYRMPRMREMAKQIYYEGKLEQFKMAEEELEKMRQQPLWVFFLFAFSILEFSKFYLVGDDAKSIIESLLYSFTDIPAFLSSGVGIETDVVDFAMLIGGMLIVAKLFLDLIVHAFANLFLYNKYVLFYPIFGEDTEINKELELK